MFECFFPPDRYREDPFFYLDIEIIYLEVLGDLVNRLIAHITHIVTLLMPFINLLTKSSLTLQADFVCFACCGLGTC